MKKKINAIMIIILLGMFLSVIFLTYENRTYQRQIDERDKFIQVLLVKDSISSKLVDIEDQDSILIYKYVIGDEGKPLKYNDLLDEMLYYRRQAEIKDRILVTAKRKYNFNYSFKESGDTLIIGLWNKTNNN